MIQESYRTMHQHLMKQSGVVLEINTIMRLSVCPSRRWLHMIDRLLIVGPAIHQVRRTMVTQACLTEIQTHAVSFSRSLCI